MAAPTSPPTSGRGAATDSARSSTSRNRRWVPAVAVVVAVLLGVVAARTLVGELRPHLYTGTVLQAPTAAPPLDGIQVASGDELDLAAHRDEVVLVFFGYTYCPDVCPLTLSTVARARAELDVDDRDRVNVVMISVDPERDDPVSVQRYVEFFDPSFVGATGDRPAVDLAATRYGIFHQRSGGGVGIDVDADPEPADDERAPEEYLIDHTASLLGIGPDGRLRVVWSPDVGAEALAADLADLLP